MSSMASDPTICPPIELNESLIGYIWRVAHANNRMRMKGMVSNLLHRQALQPPWIVPSNLRMLCEQLDPVCESPAVMLQEHTCLPALLPLVRADRLQLVLDHVLRGERHSGIAACLGLASKGIRSRVVMAMCIECAREDLRTLGFAYWRREHSLPGVSVCAWHQLPLVAGCGACAFSQPLSRQPRLPQLSCWCGHAHRTVAAHPTPVLQRLEKMAQYAVSLLTRPLAFGQPQRLGAYFQACALQRGYAAGLHWRAPRLCADMQKHYPRALFEVLNASMGAGEEGWVSKSLIAGLAPLALGRTMLLLDFFGQKVPCEQDIASAIEDIAEYKQACAPAKTRLSPSYDRAASRARILEYLRSHAGAGRQELLRDLSTDALRARNFDAAWYDLVCPPKRTGDRISSAQRTRMHVAIDLRTVAHLRRRHAELLEHPGRPKRLTRRALLAGVPCENQIGREQLRDMPHTRAALYWRVETDQQWRERYARWILLELKNDPKRVERASHRTGLTVSDVDAIKARLELGDS